MGANKKQLHEQQLAKIAASTEKFRLLVGLGGGVVKWGGLALIAYFVAGSDTAIDLKAAFSGEINKYLLHFLLVLVGGSTAYGWRRERLLRKQEVAGLSGHVKTLERVIDKGRSSTGLGPSGEIVEGRVAPRLPSGEKK